MFKSYSFRLYPTPQQEALFSRQFGSCRFVYNKMLDKRNKAYKRRQESLTFNKGLNKFLNKLKEVYPWLFDTYSQALQMQGRNLDTAFENFFKHPNQYGYPNFKKKSTHASMQYPQGVKLHIAEQTVFLPNMGLVKCVFHRKFKGKVKTVSVRRDSSGKYNIRILVDTEQTEHQPLKEVHCKDDVLGIDLGIESLAVCSDHTVFDNNKRLKMYEKKLTRLQRQLSRKKGSQKGVRKSNNFLKQRLVVARLYEKIANCRKDDIEKATTLIADKSQVAVSMETLNIKGMEKNRHLSKAVADASMSLFQTRLKQKLNERGKIFVQCDRFFPSSQLCSNCGYQNKALKLQDRSWECPVCHVLHNRDYNASLNLQKEGYSLLASLPMDGGEVTPVKIVTVDDRTTVPKKHTVVEAGRDLKHKLSDAPRL